MEYKYFLSNKFLTNEYIRLSYINFKEAVFLNINQYIYQYNSKIKINIINLGQ